MHGGMQSCPFHRRQEERADRQLQKQRSRMASEECAGTRQRLRFVDPEAGRATPYGIYDIARNKGLVVLGTSFDTACFAVNALRQWWANMGEATYTRLTGILITADGGGSNGYRVRLWKVGLQELANEWGLPITVCHPPPGTSKWNPIEHRMFSPISSNWRGKPLRSHDEVCQLYPRHQNEKRSCHRRRNRQDHLRERHQGHKGSVPRRQYHETRLPRRMELHNLTSTNR
jgi:hypothetical protein